MEKALEVLGEWRSGWGFFSRFSFLECPASSVAGLRRGMPRLYAEILVEKVRTGLLGRTSLGVLRRAEALLRMTF